MIIENGRIAYHAIRLKPDGSTTFVQYGFDGKVLYEEQRTPPFVYVPSKRSWLDYIFGSYGV